jgi:hypothetical protein
MAFKPTPEQQRILKEGEKWFADANKRGRRPHSERFVKKCTEEMGLRFKPRKPTAASSSSKLADYLKALSVSLLHGFRHR